MPEIKISLVVFSFVRFFLEKLNRRKNRAEKQILIHKISDWTEKLAEKNAKLLTCTATTYQPVGQLNTAKRKDQTK